MGILPRKDIKILGETPISYYNYIISANQKIVEVWNLQISRGEKYNDEANKMKSRLKETLDNGK